MGLIATRRGTMTMGGMVAALLVVIVAAVCVRLGFWQLDRLEQRRALNAIVQRAMSLPPVPLGRALLDSIARDPRPFEYRSARATGRFDPVGEVLLRGRVHEGSPGVHLVTPFRLSSDSSLLLVNRGWLPSPDGATADPRIYREGAEVTLEGILHLVPEAGAGAVHAPITLDDTVIDSYRRLDRATMTRSLGARPSPVYLQVSSGVDAAEPPIPVPPPALDEGPHLGYAIQWFGFAFVAIAGFAITLYTRRRSAVSRAAEGV